MELKKFLLSNQFPYCVLPRRKVVSGFCLGVGASLVVLSLVLINLSIKASLLSPMCPGFNSFCLFSSTTNATGNVEELQNYGDLMQTVVEGKVLYKTHQGNSSASGEDDGNSLGSNGGPSLEETRVGIFSVNVKDGSFTPEEGRLGQNTESVNGSDTGNKNANFTNFNGGGEVRERTHMWNSSGKVKNASFSHGDVTAVKSIIEENVAEWHANESSLSTPVGFFTVNSSNKVTENNNVGNLSYNRDNVGSPGEKVQPSEINNQRILSKEKNSTVSCEDSQAMGRENGSYGKCDLFDGRWVRDDSKPHYPSGSCPYIDRDVNCHLNKRPDGGFLKWKWQPNGCDIPSFNATDFLEKLRGKKLVFVGDSLNRNMWESLVCILRHSIRNKKRVYEISGRTEFKKKGFYAFRFEDYNCSVDFVAAPFLVRESSFNGRNGSLETLRLDLMDRTTSMYQDADVIVFNTGHWWTHEKTSKGEDYYQEGNHVYQRLEVLEAYKKALTTWARWVDENIDGRRTQVIFRGYSVTHFSGGQWNSGGQCHKETEPILNETYLATYPSKMRALEQVIQQMRTPVIYLNISRLTDYRKDGHPSIYRKKYATIEEQITAEQSQDCSHWCLPGVPDSWNELLYASLLQAGKGSWRT